MSFLSCWAALFLAKRGEKRKGGERREKEEEREERGGGGEREREREILFYFCMYVCVYVCAHCICQLFFALNLIIEVDRKFSLTFGLEVHCFQYIWPVLIKYNKGNIL
jgi:hypothetical protein